MERVQQVISQQNIWTRALILTLAISFGLFIVGLLMGKLRHLVIEGALRRLPGAKAAILVGYYLTIIGTLHHELAHALGYLLTGGATQGKARKSGGSRHKLPLEPSLAMLCH